MRSTLVAFATLLTSVTLIGCGSSATSSQSAANTSTPSATAVAGSAVSGTGYTFNLSTGWAKIPLGAIPGHSSDDLDLVGPGVGPNGTDRTEASNVYIAFAAAPSLNTTDPSTLLQTLAPGINSELQRNSATPSGSPSTISVAGAMGGEFGYTKSSGALTATGTVIAFVHGGNLYTITLLATSANFPDSESQLKSMLTSWTWTG